MKRTLGIYSLWLREVKRFLRDRSRVIGALAPPVMFWFLLGSGIHNFSGGAERVNYFTYLFPGTLVLILLFTAIFSTISVIEDRREGFLQSVLVAPIPRSSMVLGKVLGGSTLALLQGMLFALFALALGVSASWMTLPLLLLVLFLMGLGMTGLGFLIAWKLDSTQGFHGIMNLFLMPLWVFSGALFPSQGASPWLQWIMALNPLTYCVSAVRDALYFGTAIQISSLAVTSSLSFCIAVEILFAAVTFLLCLLAVQARVKPAQSTAAARE